MSKSSWIAADGARRALHVVYFVHDLCDAAVLRRVRMLRRAGAEVTVLGFRRAEQAPEQLDEAPVIDLGRTHDGRLLHRALSVGGQALHLSALRPAVSSADVVLARNLEMLVLADAARRLHAHKARLAYECIDVHRMMVRSGLASQALRRLERALLSRCQLLILSSPAYEHAYFGPRQGLGERRPEILLLENKVFDPAPKPPLSRPDPGPPWRIGWFGMLRCRRSFELLLGLAQRSEGRVEVLFSGKPSERELPNFAVDVARARGVSFSGPYSPQDLSRLYGSVHFTWAIDFFEAGANSDWLLPNRIYEGGLHGAVPMALRTTETGRWLAKRDLGVLLDDPAEDLDPFFLGLDAPRYQALLERSRKAPRSWFAADDGDCHAFVHALAGAA